MALRHALDDGGALLDELKIPFLGRETYGGKNPPVGRDVVALEKDPPVPFKLGYSDAQLLVPGAVQQQYVRFLKRIDEKGRILSRQKTVEIGNPPLFNGKLKDVLLPLPVN